MQTDTTDTARLAEALWAQLGQLGWARLSLAEAAREAGLPEDRIWQAGSPLSVILARLRQLDEQLLDDLAGDLADAGDASLQEKLLEGLMQRFELLAPHRPQFEALHRASTTDLLLAANLGLQLYEALDNLLGLCGDQGSGLARRVRVKGLVAVCLRVRPVWQKDDSPSLERTLKMLDKSLSDARDWAVSLRILRPQATRGETDDTGTDR